MSAHVMLFEKNIFDEWKPNIVGTMRDIGDDTSSLFAE